LIEVINRELLIPREEYNIGTCYDDNTETRHFHLKRVTSGGVDLAALTFNLDIQYADGNTDAASLVKEVTDKDINLVLTINNSMLQVPGTVLIQIRALDEDGVCKWTSYKSAFFVEDHINTPGHYEGNLTQLEQYEAEWGKVRDNVNQLNSRMDEVVKIHDDTPATEVEEEVIDGRVGYDGTQYDSFGTAVRQQIIDVREDMEEGTTDWTEALAAEATARQTADNTLQGNINSEAATRAATDSNLQTQINQIIAPSGEAPSAAEVQNARIGVDGTVYDTLGDAIRGQVGDFGDLKSAMDNLSEYMLYSIPPTMKPDITQGGITWSTLEDGSIKAVGQTTSTANAANLFYYQSIPSGSLKPGKRVLLYQDSSDPHNLFMQVFSKKSGGGLTLIRQFVDLKGYITWVIPDDVETVLYRSIVRSNTPIDATIRAGILTFPDINNDYFQIMNPDRILGYNEFSTAFAGVTIDLNEVLDNSFYLLTDGGTYLNTPRGQTLGFLQSIHTGTWHLQLFYSFNGGTIFKRRGTPNGATWEEWQSIVNTYNITNEYNYPSYSQTVNLTASPTITADTNQYLASTNDATDRTTDILAMLEASKTCRLGPGVFYVNNLQMPEGSTLMGCGYSTNVKLTGASDGYAIKMNSFCTVENLRIEGGDNVPPITETVGNRHGILWSGDYSHDAADTIRRGAISNVYIRFFTGGGITCYNTGYDVSANIEVANAFIWRCGAGINISYLSEFNKFTNVCCQECNYGCINNGGNNVFINCDFSRNYQCGMLMDNSQGQSPNNTHGSAIGCLFNHTLNGTVENSGTGISILNGKNGFVFDGCQIFLSKINIERTSGVTFANCNIGYQNCDININGGGTILFIGNQHQQRAPITIASNTNVHFVNCYDRSTGALIEI